MARTFEAEITIKKRISPLLAGAIDMHYHGYPEITSEIRTRLEDVEVLQLAREMGMRGMVIKSQMWPSTGRVYHLQQRVPDIHCFASIVLNAASGGLSPWLVEAAARQGAKVVWLPTWSAAHKLGQGGFSQLMQAWFPTMTFEPVLSCIDASGKVKPEVLSILKLAKDMALVLCTGHVSPEESLAIAAESERMGFTKLVFTHPLAASVEATLEQVKEMVQRGASVEMTAFDVFLGNELKRMVSFINEIGPRHFVLTTDALWEWMPPGPEFLRMFLGRLLLSGISEEDIHTMVAVNPARLLDLTDNL